MTKWIEIAIALAGLLLSAYVVFTPNPLKDALLGLIQALTAFLQSLVGGG